MPRRPRLIAPGAYHHVTIRGNDRQAIFLDENDYRRYQAELRRCLERHGCVLVAYALMPNHVHLVLHDQKARLSYCMRDINRSYSKAFNMRHGRVGHLYQNRFFCRLIEQDAYLLEVTRYIHLNPVRARLVTCPDAYPWSSYRVFIGTLADPMVQPELVWSILGASRDRAPERYRLFVETEMEQHLPVWEQRLRQLKLLAKVVKVPGTNSVVGTRYR